MAASPAGCVMQALIDQAKNILWPGRRSAKERTEAVLALIGGKKSVDVLSKQFGVSVATIES